MRVDCAPLARKHLWETQEPHRSAKEYREKGKKGTNTEMYLPK